MSDSAPGPEGEARAAPIAPKDADAGADATASTAATAAAVEGGTAVAATAEDADSPATREALAQIRIPPPAPRKRSPIPLMAASLVLALGAAYALSPGKRTRPLPPNLVVVRGERAASAEDNEAALAGVLEQAVAQVPGVAHLETRSDATGTVARIFVAEGKDPEAVLSAVRSGVSGVQKDVPADAHPFVVSREDRPAAEGRYVVEGGNLDPASLRDFAERVVGSELHTLPGVRVSTCGGAKRQLVATIDDARLRALGVRWDEVVAALSPPSLLGGPPSDLGALSSRVLRETPQKLMLRDLASFTIQAAPVPCRATRDGAAGVVFGSVVADSDATLTKVATRLSELERKSPPGVHLHLLDFAESVADTKARRARTLRGRIFGARDPAKVLRELRETLPLADIVAFEVTEDTLRFVARASAEEERTPRELALAAARRLAPFVGCIDWESTDHVASVRVRIRGESLEELRRLGDSAATAARGAKGVIGAALTTHRAPEVIVDVDRQRAARFGVRAAEVSEQLTLQTEGRVVGRFGEGADLLDVLVRGSGAPATPEGLPKVSIATATQGAIPAGEVATFRRTEREPTVLREDRVRALDVCVYGDGKLERAVQSALAGLVLPAGYRLDVTPSP